MEILSKRKNWTRSMLSQ